MKEGLAHVNGTSLYYEIKGNPAYISLTDEIGQGIKGATVLVISGGTHFINLERPKEFNHAVLEFLDAHASRLKSPAD